MLMDPVNVIVSPKGGTGKTLIAIMLVDQLLAAGHARVLCVESDTQNQDLARVMARRGRDDVTVARINLARSAGWARMRDVVGRHSGPVVVDTPAASQTSFDTALDKGWVDDFLAVRRMRSWIVVTRDAITLEQLWRYLHTMPPHDVVVTANAKTEGPMHIAGALRPVTADDAYIDLVAANPEPACAQVVTALQRHRVTEVMVPYLAAGAAQLVAGKRLDFGGAEAALVAQLGAATTRLGAVSTDQARDHHAWCDRELTAMREWRETMRARCWPIICPDAGAPAPVRGVGGGRSSRLITAPVVGDTVRDLLPLGVVEIAAPTGASAVAALFRGPTPDMSAEPPLEIVSEPASAARSTLHPPEPIADGQIKAVAVERGFDERLKLAAATLDILRSLQAFVDEYSTLDAVQTGARDTGCGDPIRGIVEAEVALYAQRLFDLASADARAVLGEDLYQSLAELRAGVEAPVARISERARELFQRFNPDWDASPELAKLRAELARARTPALAALQRAGAQLFPSFVSFVSLVDASPFWSLAVPDDDLYWVAPNHRSALGAAAGYACVVSLSREAHAAALERRAKERFRDAGPAGNLDDSEASADGPALRLGDGPAFVAGVVAPDSVGVAVDDDPDGIRRFQIQPKSDVASVRYDAGRFSRSMDFLAHSTGAASGVLCVVARPAQYEVLALRPPVGMMFLSTGMDGSEWLSQIAHVAGVPQTLT